MAYTPYKQATYPSGSGVFDIFTFNVAGLTGGSSIAIDVNFSNPCIILGGVDSSTGEFLNWERIVQNIMVPVSAPAVNSGILRQTDPGIGPIIEQGALVSTPLTFMRAFQLFDRYRPGYELTTDGGLGIISVIGQPTYHSNFQFIELLDRSFDSFAFPANQRFTMDPGGFDISISIAVKRGSNQPFFTLQAP